MNDEPAMLCYTDLVELCRQQQERLDTIEAAMREAIRSIDTMPTPWSAIAARRLLCNAFQAEQVE